MKRAVCAVLFSVVSLTLIGQPRGMDIDVLHCLTGRWLGECERVTEVRFADATPRSWVGVAWRGDGKESSSHPRSSQTASSISGARTDICMRWNSDNRSMLALSASRQRVLVR
jgi:hypothetical protein